jgi:CRP/FNR family transcriptional regulator
MQVGFLDRLSPAARDLVLRGSARISHPAGTVAHHREGTQMAYVVERGLIRMFVQSEDGRQASVAYFHPGDTHASLPILGPPAPVDLQAVEDSIVLMLDPVNLKRLLTTSPQVMEAAITTLGGELSHLVQIITVRSLGSMTERLAFDLLERASRAQLESGELDFAITHEHLAESIGSAREVVTRIIGDLRQRRVLVTAPGRIRVVDPGRLALILNGLLAST